MCSFLRQAEREGQELPCRSLPCRCSWTSPTLCHHHCPGLSFTFGMSLTQTLLDEVVFIPWVSPRPLGDKPSLKAAGWYQLSPYPAPGVKQALSTLRVLHWLLSEGKVIQDILTDLYDLLSPLQYLSYWRTRLFLSGDEQTPPWGPVCPKRTQEETQPWKVSSETSPSSSPTLHLQVFPKTLPGWLCQEQDVRWAGPCTRWGP